MQKHDDDLISFEGGFSDPPKPYLSLGVCVVLLAALAALCAMCALMSYAYGYGKPLYAWIFGVWLGGTAYIIALRFVPKD